MARNTSELVIRAIDQASATLERIGRHGSNSMNQVSRQADIASRSMSYLKTAAISAAAALGAQKAGSWLISSNAQMEQYNQTLKVVLKNQEKAAETMEWATKFAAQTPFEIPGIVEATVRLQAYGLEAKKYLGDLGDMAAAMGKPLMQAVEAVADAQNNLAMAA
ncbi:MAG: hypothetical protein M0P69_03240 [Bacteroidales bacterium]|nr:hypothetical protein [Bacteroidales bacterium]